MTGVPASCSPSLSPVSPLIAALKLCRPAWNEPPTVWFSLIGPCRFADWSTAPGCPARRRRYEVIAVPDQADKYTEDAVHDGANRTGLALGIATTGTSRLVRSPRAVARRPRGLVDPGHLCEGPTSQ